MLLTMDWMVQVLIVKLATWHRGLDIQLCSPLTPSLLLWLPQIYRKHSPHFTVETNNATELVATAAGNIERLLANRSEALKVSVTSC